MPPKKKTASFTVDIDKSAAATAIAIPAGYTEFKKGVTAIIASSDGERFDSRIRLGKTDSGIFVHGIRTRPCVHFYAPAVFR